MNYPIRGSIVKPKNWLWLTQHGLYGLLSTFLFYVLGNLLGLSLLNHMIIMISAFGLGVWFSITEKMYKRQETDFYMMIDFFQQVLALFKHHPKIYFSFTESQDLIKGHLKESVLTWINDLEQGKDLNHSALFFLKSYPHFVIGNLIHLMVAVELFGTHDYGLSLDIIQDDIEEWAEDTLLFKQMEKQQRNRIILLSLFALMIAYFSQSMLKKTGLQAQMNLTDMALLVFLLMIQITVAVVQNLLSKRWIEDREEIWKI